MGIRTTSFLDTRIARMPSMLDQMWNNYVGLWRGDWGVINQWYMLVYHVILYPMMLYLAYTMIQGLWKQSKSGKK